MMAPGFKPVGWVAAVAGAALSCYMLSLNVAAERAELAKVERQIIAAKRDIRALQTELGTRGRLAQLEQWNADVLALSAPTSSQFLENELTLARFDQRPQTIEERSAVRMASAEPGADEPGRKIEAPVIQAAAAAPAPQAQPQLVHHASYTPMPKSALTEVQAVLPELKPARAAPKAPSGSAATGKVEVASVKTDTTKAAMTKAPVKATAAKTPDLKADAASKKPAPAKPLPKLAAADKPARAKAAPTKVASKIDSKLVKAIGAAARREEGSGGR